MINTLNSFIELSDSLKHFTSFKLFGKDSSAIYANNASTKFMYLRFYTRHNHSIKLINEDITVAELRNIFDSNEYESVEIDCISSMSKACAKMIEEFVNIYKKDANKDMCVVLLHKTNRNEILEVIATERNAKGVRGSGYYKF